MNFHLTVAELGLSGWGILGFMGLLYSIKLGLGRGTSGY